MSQLSQIRPNFRLMNESEQDEFFRIYRDRRAIDLSEPAKHTRSKKQPISSTKVSTYNLSEEQQTAVKLLRSIGIKIGREVIDQLKDETLIELENDFEEDEE